MVSQSGCHGTPGHCIKHRTPVGRLSFRREAQQRVLDTGSGTTVSSLGPDCLINEAELSVPIGLRYWGHLRSCEGHALRGSLGISVLGCCQHPGPCCPPGWLFTTLSVVWPRGREKEVGSKQRPIGRSLEAARSGLGCAWSVLSSCSLCQLTGPAGWLSPGKEGAGLRAAASPPLALRWHPDELLGTSEEAQDVDKVSVPFPG